LTMSSDSGSDSEDEEFADPGLVDPNVVTKYKESAKISNDAVAAVSKACVAGANVLELCNMGDGFITEAVKGVYTKKVDGKAMAKGVAFPTSISINNCVCASCPPDGSTTTLADGDVVKIDLATHLDGYIATVAGTTVVGATDNAPVSGRAADVIAAAYTGAEAMLRLVKAEGTNASIPPVLETIAKSFKCSVVEGVLSHQMKRYMIDGEKCVLAKPDVDNKVDDQTFERNEVYHIDVAMSTGDGKTRELDEKERSVFKCNADEQYSLKMKASRALLSEIKEKYPTLPFTLRGFDARAKLGMTELVKHDMVHPYPVLYEKDGELTAHVKYTVLIMPSGQQKITSMASPPLDTDNEVTDEEVVAILSQELAVKKKRGKKKKGVGGGAAQPAPQ